MEIMLDTNILFSAIFFLSAGMTSLFEKLTKEHKIVLCSYSFEELYRITRRKVPEKLGSIELFLQKLPYRFIHTPKVNFLNEDEYKLRDKANYPILLSALLADVDILITGDSDFDDVILDKPEILKPAEFMRVY